MYGLYSRVAYDGARTVVNINADLRIEASKSAHF